MAVENKRLFQLLAFACLAVANGLIFSAVSSGTNSVIYSIAWKIAAFLLLVTGFLSWDITRLGPANDKSIRSILIHYLFARIHFSIVGPISYVIFQRNSKKFRQLQDNYLLFCLKQNGKTALGKNLGLSSVSLRDDFIKKCPVTKYPAYEPYVKRIEENGEKDVTISYPVDVIFWTSGTTGKNKRFPSNLRMRSNVGMVALLASQYKFNRELNDNTVSLERTVLGHTIAEAKINERGVVMGCVTATLMTKKVKDFYGIVSSSPRPIFDVTSEKDCCYLHLLFAVLSRNNVSNFSLLLGSQAYQFFRIFESNWQQLCDDIETGTLWKELKISNEARNQLETLMQPNPALAAAIRAECEKGFKDIVSRIWPHFKYIISITTGAFSCYKTLMEEKYTGTVPIITHSHGGTEGNYGQNLTPLKFPPEFVMDPDSNFVEFIHESNLDEDQPETILPEKGVVGENYEYVITNHYMGLWRYRTGDVVKLKGFWNTLPMYEFSFRHGQLLNVAWEKTPESLFFAALEKSVKQWNVQLHDYTTTEYMHWLDEQVAGNKKELDDNADRFYVVFLDIVLEDGSIVFLTDTQKQILDNSLKEVHEVYKVLRENGSIQPMKVFQVQPGTFSALREKMLCVNKMAVSAQLKMPRVIRNVTYLNFLKNNLIKGQFTAR